jgi:hypothetical protein
MNSQGMPPNSDRGVPPRPCSCRHAHSLKLDSSCCPRRHLLCLGGWALIAGKPPRPSTTGATRSRTERHGFPRTCPRPRKPGPPASPTSSSPSPSAANSTRASSASPGSRSSSSPRATSSPSSSAPPSAFCSASRSNFTKAFDPIIQVLRPVSPLAWLPLGMVLFSGLCASPTKGAAPPSAPPMPPPSSPSPSAPCGPPCSTPPSASAPCRRIT